MTKIAGKYEVIRQLGEGGSGAVFLVRHCDLNLEYALKLLEPALSNDPTALERFKREAAALERVSHPGCIRLRDFGKTEQGLYYFTADYCAGSSLRQYAEEKGPFSIGTCLTLSAKILDVLAAAHEAGVVHRDIKPDNIMIEESSARDLAVKILDFGIAKVKESEPAQKTVESAPFGTPHYMAPEQAAGDSSLDHRVDIYACGILLYELIAGVAPFRADSVTQILLKHLTQPPEPFPASRDVPEYVEKMVFKALHKDREKRYQSAAEFRDACLFARGLLVKGGLDAPANVGPDPSSWETQHARKTKILCLDDDAMMLDILSYILQREGYQVYAARDSSAIHDYLFREHVQLLITDVNMPGLSGSKICKMLKRATRELKILLFSNLPERDLERVCSECKADGWISKNTRPDQWLHTVSEVVRSMH